MSEPIFIVGYLVLVATLLLGCYRYLRLDRSMRIVVTLLLLSFVVETSALGVNTSRTSDLKNTLYYLCPVIGLIIVTSFFITLNSLGNYSRKLIVFGMLWLVLGASNAIWLQPLGRLNTNMLMVECFSIITMCLYSIYRMLKSDKIDDISKVPHFWISVLWLVQWSATFYFWAFVKILYRRHWAYMELALNLNVIVNIIVYLGTALVFIRYPKKMSLVENR